MAFGPILRFSVGELRVELAPLDKEAVAEFINYKHGGGLQRYSVTRYLGLGFAPTIETEQEWYEKTRTNFDNLVWGIWLIEGEGEQKTRTLIGNSSLNNINEAGHNNLISQAASGSLIFRPEYWGKGIASAAHKARAWYAFKYVGIHRIKSEVLQENGGSRKALERTGYRYLHTERNETYHDGNLLHLDSFELLNPLDSFWNQWWHGDRPPAAAVESRKRTTEALEWAQKNVELV